MNARDLAGGEREPRLGLVCYGGISLAVYMHGVMRESNELVLASNLDRINKEKKKL